MLCDVVVCHAQLEEVMVTCVLDVAKMLTFFPAAVNVELPEQVSPTLLTGEPAATPSTESPPVTTEVEAMVCTAFVTEAPYQRIDEEAPDVESTAVVPTIVTAFAAPTTLSK